MSCSRACRAAGGGTPLSTHSSIQILANEDTLPGVRAYWSVGSDAGQVSGVQILTLEAARHARVQAA